MQGSFQDHPEIKQQNSCPNLGLGDDQATYSGFPSQMNACYHVRPVATPNIAHQRAYCLHSNHIDCPLLAAPPGEKMPKQLMLKTRGLSKEKRYHLIVLGVLSIAIIVVVLIRFGSSWLSRPIEETIPTPDDLTSVARETIIVTVTAEEITNTPSPTEVPPTETQVPITPTQEDPLLALDTPIGDEIQFIIHRVTEGETLQIFATQYNTTVEAITAINYDLIVPLWTNWLVIIPLDITEVDELPVFEAHQVEVENIPLRDLAEQLSASLNEMMRYNNLEASHILHQAEWVLVPRERP